MFRDVVGVSEVESGYIGGSVENPTYKQVCSGTTGHAEGIRVTFDPEVISYAEMLDVFLGTHDPTQLNRQGNDVGTQYRSAIFPLDDNQRAEAEAAIARANEDHGGKVVTTIEEPTHMVSGRGLPSGILGRRRPAQSLLPGDDPAQASEAAQEFPEQGETGRLMGVLATGRLFRRSVGSLAPDEMHTGRVTAGCCGVRQEADCPGNDTISDVSVAREFSWVYDPGGSGHSPLLRGA